MFIITGGYDMNINYELYKIFYVVANCGNITKASQELLLSQPAVTKQIKQLEDQLGGELFIRTKRGVILTENGREIYHYIKQGLDSFSNAEAVFSNLKELNNGHLRIGISTTLAKIFLMPYLEKFHKMYPNIIISLLTDPSTLLRKQLKEGRIDFLISKEEEIEEEDLCVTRLGVLHHTFIASPKTYSDLKDKVIPLKKIGEYPMLLQKSPSISRKWFDQICKENKIHIHSSFEIASSHLLEDFVKIGLGIGLASKEYVQNDIDNGELLEIKTTPPFPEKPFALITLKNTIPSFGARKAIAIILNKED